MDTRKLSVLNFKETRRRSLLVWESIPTEYLHWKPDVEAMSCIEMIRHVLEGEHLFYTIIKNCGNLGAYNSPWNGLEYKDVAHELMFAEPFKKEFYKALANYTSQDLSEIVIRREEVNQVKLLGDYVNRMVYHEAVHTGQLLGYLRTLGVKRPQIWD